MGTPFRDDAIGGTILLTPAIQSPNFVHSISGWSVNQDGSAEFSNVTVRGTFNGLDFIINSAGSFYYSGTPATGNLLIAIAPSSGQDQFGNAYTQGISLHNTGASGLIEVRPDLSALLFYA